MSLGAQLLTAPVGVAFLALGEASGRLDEALRSNGVTLCLAAHAAAEVRRGTDGGRLSVLRSDPPAWLQHAAARVDEQASSGHLDWWSKRADFAIHRQLSDGMTGIEVVDHLGHARSLAEEADAHLHTFTRVDGDVNGSIRRWRPDPDVVITTIDGPDDWERVGRRPDRTAAGTHLTLRGAMTIDHAPGPREDWPWELAGVWWNEPVPGTPLPEDDRGRWHHDHEWVQLGRRYDPRFDEGDEVDGSELS
jgi:hypothetical protein